MKFRDDDRNQNVIERERPIKARGGFSFLAIATGVVVAFGAMFLLSALVGGILAATGVDASEIETASGGEKLAASVSIVVALFLAYLWGGYTAGRMSRGAGLINGFLVPVVALVVAAIVAAVVNALGATANLNLPFNESQLPIEGDNLADFGQVVGIASLIAMFVGGILGGILGQRWHSRLERRVEDEHAERADAARREVEQKQRDREREQESERLEAERERLESERVETVDRRSDAREAPGRTVATERRPAPAPPPDTTDRRT